MLYLHIGLHKTATTFFQHEVFPKIEGIKYIPWSRFEQYFRPQSMPCLISREGLSGGLFAPICEREVSIRALAQCFSEARILLSFRSHDQYIVSTYREYVHEGGTRRFSDYLALDGRDDGVMRREDFNFSRLLDCVIRNFPASPPFLFFQEELKNNLPNLLGDLGRFLNAPALKPEEITTRVRHNTGLPYYSASILRRVNRFNKSALNPKGRWNLNNKYTRWLRIDPHHIGQHWLAFLPDRPFLHAAERQALRDYYADDWSSVVKNARDSGRNLPASLT